MEDNSLNHYISTISNTDLLTLSEEMELNELRKKGDKKARERLIMANLRLVVKIAHDYAKYGFSIQDLISEGNMGLTRAIDKYDSSKGKVSNYASWWIKQYMRKWISNHKQPIRIPIHMMERMGKIRTATLELSELLGREPTTLEVAKKLNISEESVKSANSSIFKMSHLDAPLGEDGSLIGDITPDKNQKNPLQKLLNKNRKSEIFSMMEKLEDRERDILIKRFGLDGAKPMGLEEIGEIYGITRERIRQIELKAKHRMRDFLEGLDDCKTKEQIKEAEIEKGRMEVLKEYAVA